MSVTRGLRAPMAWLAAGLLAAASFAALSQDALVPVPKLTAHAIDQTGTLTVPELAAVEAKLAAFEAARGSQVAVLMVPTIGAEPIEDFALRVTDAWKLGRKGVDDGVLFVIAKQQRKIRIQTGRGVQGTLTDATSGRIIRERVTPAFRDGNFAAGIDAGVDAILKAIEGESLPPVKAGTTSRKVDTLPSSGFDFLWLAFFGVPVVAMMLRPMVGRAGSALATGGITGVGAWLILGSLIAGVIGAVIAFIVAISMGTNALRQGRSGGGAWIPGGGFGGGGGGFGGGGGGGFSGGGGGFDGGGASGNW
ncbi:TPM domain-containing protein [Usitatibacter rugosus]|nr:TPM domain-containing protein [Usitatibacter rugosus]